MAQKNTLKDLLTTGDDFYRPEDTPPHSDHSLSPAHSLPSSPEYSTLLKDDSDEEMLPSTGITKGMLDSSRLTLCMVMLVMITVNPFGIVMKKYGGVQESDKFLARGILFCKYICPISACLIPFIQGSCSVIVSKNVKSNFDVALVFLSF